MPAGSSASPLSTYRAQGPWRQGLRRHGDARKRISSRALYIVNTHTPVLFFSTLGMVYKLKVYQLPVGTPQSARQGHGQPAAADRKVRRISTGHADAARTRAAWGELQRDVRDRQAVLYAATTSSDFVDDQPQRQDRHEARDEGGDRLIGVRTCSDQRRYPAVHRARASASASRSPTCASSRAASSNGVRGIKLAGRRPGHLHVDPQACGIRHREP